MSGDAFLLLKDGREFCRQMYTMYKVGPIAAIRRGPQLLELWALTYEKTASGEIPILEKILKVW